MIQLIVGWVQDFFNFSNVKEFKPVEKLTPSQKGYKFEHDELKRLMLRLKRFETVEFTDVEGTPLTPQIVENRYGKDGGIDCVIRIIAPTERGAKIVATKIRNILINGDY
ncbi:hypothetical protein [Laspinema olomoucense]|uniref:Uncharacterized protein n=1 Tax=Laspinema olomoucense D3b TaxID=2953688 RepID=A0ABT2NCC6_9CYAN|nr:MULTISPECIES: hypothetical protein [unclassified Laspinema]MCT7973963.1 hypothetical protein [Laspinema sp. D3d]MCT7980353.1 hypothetical protein [Laspinema sp. D3b]MCT7991939.1 hypothetical protein [Laspinema sp. D3a]